MKLLLALFISTTVIFGQDDGWKMVEESSTSKVYTRKTDESKYEQIRIVSKVKAPISEIINALEDVNYHKEWVYETDESRLIEKRGVGDFDYYALMDMPFPVKDRDVVIRMEREQNPTTKVVNIKSYAVEGGVEKDIRYVRIDNFLSTYKITPLKDNWVEVDYFMFVDPGGTLPAWIVNLFTLKGPVSTMDSMVKLIDTDYYKGKSAKGIVD